MNKIYKVVWSKAKHCYVVTSELAKRNGKGCGTRSLRMATVSMGVAALLCTGAHSLFSPSVAEAAEVTVTDAGNPSSDIYHIQTSILSTYENIYVVNNTLAQTGFCGNTMNVTGGTTTTYSFAGAGNALNQLTEDKISGNTINFSGGQVVNLFGALSVSSEKTVSGNTANMTGGTVTKNVYGGYSAFSDVKGNKVDISGGEVTKEVYGGLSSSTSAKNVDGNSVSISKNATVGSNVYGGKIDWDKSGTVTNNSVTVSSGTVGGGVFGGYSSQTHGTGAVSDNTVEMTGGTISGYGYIVGGYSTENFTTEDPTKVDVTNNVVKMSGNVDFKTSVVGGWAQGQGIVQNNRVEFSANNVDHYGQGEFGISVTGGSSGSGGATDNKVIFSKGTVYSVKGGLSSSSTATLKGDVLRNTVEMSGGTVYGYVTGGNSGFGKADSNEVTISKGSVGHSGSNSAVYGGSGASSASGNTVTIKGEAQLDSATSVYGGYAYDTSTSEFVLGTAANNTVNIEKAVTVKGLYGGYGDETKSTGNTLNVKATGVKAEEVKYFQTIVLGNVTWEDNAAVLEATTVENVKTLDIQDLQFDQTPDSGSMALLKSGNALGVGGLNIGLAYKDGGTAKTATSEELVTGVTAEAEFNPITQNGVTLTGTQKNLIKSTQTNVANDTITYEFGKQKDVKNVAIGTVAWGGAALDGSSADYNYANVDSIGTDKFDVKYAEGEPQTITAGDSMTLLKANETLTAIVNEEKSKAYSYSPVSGVTVDATITGKLANSGNNVVFTAAENKAGKLTFGDVEWKTSGTLVTRPKNITFAGADVDTTKINFTNMIYLDANQKMTLVSDFGDSVGTVSGSKYMVGTAFEGEGEASLSGSDLIFTTKTEAGLSEQTHKTVMAMDAGLAMLQTGSEFVDKTVDGLADKNNAGNDGVSTFASVGGGASRYSTGSHVNTHTWNAIVAVGKTNETKKGTIEYGVFGEYGKGSYKLYSDAGNGDGDAHYAGGGLLAKWTNKHDVYAEASIRAGRMSDSSSDIMQDGLGNRYGYNVHANYYGTHVGVGRVFNYKGGKNLDVYGKFFYTKRDGVEYDAPQHYDLNSVASSVLRIGARYGTTDKKWNWYGGLAYEYEFDGEAKGTVNGKEIRAASIKGSSVRGEFGMKMSATKDNPWQADISIYGYGGKHRGFGGNVSVAYTF